MTSNADFKRRVRARMAKTGESYARARLLAGRRRPQDGVAAAARVVVLADEHAVGEQHLAAAAGP
jgi:hypothetical protein